MLRNLTFTKLLWMFYCIGLSRSGAKRLVVIFNEPNVLSMLYISWKVGLHVVKSFKTDAAEACTQNEEDKCFFNLKSETSILITQVIVNDLSEWRCKHVLYSNIRHFDYLLKCKINKCFKTDQFSNFSIDHKFITDNFKLRRILNLHNCSILWTIIMDLIIFTILTLCVLLIILTV